MFMKILHTSDWHIGQQFYGYDRLEENAFMLREMARIARETAPDLFLVSGDIFHTSQPSAAAQTLLTDGLLEISRAVPGMRIVLTAGNHDSASRLEVFRNAWLKHGVHIIGAASRDINDLDSMMVILPGVAVVAAIPYFSERFMDEGYYAAATTRAVELAEGELPVILMAHTTVSGCDFSGHEENGADYIGGITAISPDDLGSGFDYCALGHIHRPQFVGKNHKIRYSGSPMPVSFDEKYPHSVTLVEIEAPGLDPDVTEIPVTNPFPLVSLPAEGAVSFDECMEMLSQFDDEIPAYIRLNIRQDDKLPMFHQQKARNAAEGKKCRLCHINLIRPEETDAERTVMSVDEFKATDPVELALRYFKEKGDPLSESTENILKTLKKQIAEEDNL